MAFVICPKLLAHICQAPYFLGLNSSPYSARFSARLLQFHAYMCQPLYFLHFNFMLYSARNLYHIKENYMHIYARLLITSILIPCYIMPGFSTILSSL